MRGGETETCSNTEYKGRILGRDPKKSPLERLDA